MAGLRGVGGIRLVGIRYCLNRSNGTGFFQGEVFRLLFGVDQGGEGGVIKDQVYRIGSFELSGGETVSDP